MSIIKYLAIITVSSALLTGCSPSPTSQTDQRQHRLGPWTAYNSSQAFGGKVGNEQIRGIVYSATTPTGAHPSTTGYWLRSQNHDYYAPIESISYNGAGINGVTTVGGWLAAVTLNGNEVLSDTFLLELHVGEPANAALRITGTVGDLTASYGQYVVESFVSADTGWEPFCPHPYVNQNQVHTNLTEYMIPIGGASWQLSGERVENANSIQLSCTHDSIGGCVTWGYAPWDSVGTQSLRDTHQACTRMKRADICGTGDALTTTNQSYYLHTEIQVWDAHGIHVAHPQTPETMEAWFDTNGATCFNRSEYRTTEPNYVGHLDELLRTRTCPPLPACSKGSTGLVASARPCTVFGDEGECVGN